MRVLALSAFIYFLYLYICVYLWIKLFLIIPVISGRAGRDVIFKARIFPEEGQAHLADRTVTLLADDDIGGGLVRDVLVVDLVALDEENHAGVLLDGAGFAQV